jgi:AraC-type DNA-binding domain-containing proteins
MSCLNDIFRSVEYIQNNINNNLTVDECSKVALLAKPYYSKMFSFYIGETPMKYIQKQKLLYSAKCLFGSKKIVDIAMDPGYQSHEAFTRAFKKEFGMSPTEYRSLNQTVVMPIDELNELECAFLFHSNEMYIRKGSDIFKGHKEIQKSLIEKGYIYGEKIEWSIEGKQLSEKYHYDCTCAILQSYKKLNDFEACYQYTKKIVNISRLLFFKLAYELYENGFTSGVEIGSCGSNCFECKAFLATIEDDDDLRMEYMNEMERQGVYIRKEDIYCFGCMSKMRASFCHTRCQRKPCCDKHWC